MNYCSVQSLINHTSLIGTLFSAIIADYISLSDCCLLLVIYSMLYLLLSSIFLNADDEDLSVPSVNIHQINKFAQTDDMQIIEEKEEEETIPSESAKKLFEYENVSILDEPEKLISLLKDLSVDVNYALDAIKMQHNGNNNNNNNNNDVSFEPDRDNDIKYESKNINDGDTEENIFDPNWERYICSMVTNKKIWGSYNQCSSKTLKLRGSNYLTDKMKISSKECLLSLANIDIFRMHHDIHHMAQNKASWFYQYRDKLPRSLFFIIIHLRLNSYSTSIVQYFYIDRNKFNHLLENEGKCHEMFKKKGNGYFGIGCPQYDESGMFWDFINGECKFRNDRLKLMARKEEGPWYLYIPSKPAIIGKKVPIRYYRGYDAKYLNSTKIYNTRSDAYTPYDFKTLYHDSNRKGDRKRDIYIPCDCGKCEWVNTNGEYADYLEIDIYPEVNMMAMNTIRVAYPLAKSLQVEMHWTLEGQINNIQLPERMLCSARLMHVDLDTVAQLNEGNEGNSRM